MSIQVQPLKVLAIGSPLSAIPLLLSKITTFNQKHGPFDACVIVGDLFKDGSDGSEIDGVRFPIPTYFSIGKYSLPEIVQQKITESGGEVTDNLVFLGRSGVLATAQGLKVGAVGGAWDAAQYEAGPSTNPYAPIITADSVSAVIEHRLSSHTVPDSELAAARQPILPSHFHGLDFLLLSSPPPNLTLLSPSASSLAFTLAEPASPLKEVVEKSRPRYMFWTEGEGFWEREPIGWIDGGSEKRWTRAVKLGALGEQGDGKKTRWYYAFTLPAQTPDTPIPVRPANATPSPFGLVAADLTTNGKKRNADDNQELYDASVTKKPKSEESRPVPEGYVCRICQQPGHWIQECPSRDDIKRDVKSESGAQGGHDPDVPPPGYVCKICQGTDHYIRLCPRKDQRDANGNKVPPSDYVCKICQAQGQHYIRECPVAKERDQGRSRNQLGPAECWFCLSNPKVTKHLVTAIGKHTYLTLPKGQIIPTFARHLAPGQQGPLVPGGGHVLIIPIAHHPTLLSIPAEDAMDIISEVEAYKSALRACYASYKAVPVTFEVGRLTGRGGHAHVQVVPIPEELQGKVADSFRAAGAAKGIDWEAEPERALARVGAAGNYFKVECPDGTKLVHLLKGNFDLQFGRMVIAGLLGLHHRVDWKECSGSEAEEKADAQKFKQAFKPFQPKV